MIRGINRADIFHDEQDRQKFLERLGANVLEAKCSIYAWTLMSNHVHLLFKSGEKGISSVMRNQLTWYAMYFNRRHGRTGHLFENRYKSILCEEERYLLALIRYIHLNPLRAGIVKEPGNGGTVIKVLILLALAPPSLGRNQFMDKEGFRQTSEIVHIRC